MLALTSAMHALPSPDAAFVLTLRDDDCTPVPGLEMYGFNPRGAPFPPAPPHQVGHVEGCELSGQKRKVAFVHIGKTAGSMVHGLLDANGVSYTEFELGMLERLKQDLDNYDTFIVATRDPISRSVSAFNFDHPIGGGSTDVSAIVNEAYVAGLPTMCVPAVNLTNPATEFNHNRDGAIAPYRVPNPINSPLATPATYDLYAGAVPTGPKPLMMSVFTDCFPQLPGGVNAFAEALEGAGACSDLARRHLFETSEAEHMNNGFAELLIHTGLLEKLRRSMPEAGGKREADLALAVVRLENVDDDVAHMWEKLCVTNATSEVAYVGVADDFPRHSDTNLSAAGEAALRKYLVQEYYALDALFAIGAKMDAYAGAAHGVLRTRVP